MSDTDMVLIYSHQQMMYWGEGCEYTPDTAAAKVMTSEEADKIIASDSGWRKLRVVPASETPGGRLRLRIAELEQQVAEFSAALETAPKAAYREILDQVLRTGHDTRSAVGDWALNAAERAKRTLEELAGDPSAGMASLAARDERQRLLGAAQELRKAAHLAESRGGKWAWVGDLRARAKELEKEAASDDK